MATTFVTLVDLSFTKNNTWQDVDCSAYIPATATGVLLDVIISGADLNAGVRKNGSTNNNYGQYSPASAAHTFMCIGVDGSQIFEAIAESASVSIILHGYTEDEATFFTNSITKTISGSGVWEDINISADTGANTATAAIFLFYSNGNAGSGGWYHRDNGSTDNVLSGGRAQGIQCQIIGVDGSEICEGYAQFASYVNRYLVGYFTSEITMSVNATDVSLGSTGSYVDLPTQAGASGIIYFVNVHGNAYMWNIRENGSSSDDYYDGLASLSSSFVKCSSSGVCEGKIENVSVDFYQQGYFNGGATKRFFICNHI